MEGLAEKLEPKFGDLGVRWDQKVVWDEIVVMTPRRWLEPESRLWRPGRSLGPESRLGRDRCNDTWALAGTGKSSGTRSL